jgi:hypothetical protein
MSVNESADSVAKPLDSEYLSGLLDHISAAQNHLDGNDGTPLSISFLQPNAVWTAREKDSFFHALSIYSRFRPDLISHEIKTKSVQDVCNYLSILQAAASQRETTVPYLQWRQNLPIAMEVSPGWVAVEEEKAADFTTREQDWQRELAAERRRAEFKLLKKASRAESHDMGRSKRKAALRQLTADADLRARREDICGSLGFPELTAIGTILHEATDFSDSSRIKQPSVFHTSTLQHSNGHVRRLEATHTLTSPDTNGAHDASDVTITVRPIPGILTPFFAVVDIQNPLKSQGGPPPTPPPKQGSMTPLAGLSPATRRRYQKRLHMRRKRASTSGVSAIDDSLERLKPGRKKVKQSPFTEDEPQCDLECVEGEVSTMSECEDDGPSVTQKRYPRAKQMALNELRDLGFAAEDLMKLGVDVLNPEGVAKMLKYVAYHFTSSTPSLTQPVCGTSCPETPLAMVQGSQ